MPSRPSAGRWGCWFVPCPQRCGPRWGVGTATALGAGISNNAADGIDLDFQDWQVIDLAGAGGA